MTCIPVYGLDKSGEKLSESYINQMTEVIACILMHILQKKKVMSVMEKLFSMSCKISKLVTLGEEICYVSAEKDLDIVYEVVFDEPFAGGLNLR